MTKEANAFARDSVSRSSDRPTQVRGGGCVSLGLIVKAPSNLGKSSLMNLLAARDVSIVSEIEVFPSILSLEFLT